MLKKGLDLLVIWAGHIVGEIEGCIVRMDRVRALACVAAAVWGLMFGGNLSAATVPPGFTETVVSGPWTSGVGSVL